MNHLRAATTVIVPFLQLAARMESDTEKRIVLAAAARRFAMDGPVREAYMAVVRGMESDTERRLALSALASRAPASRPAAPGLWNTDLELVGAHDGEPAYELTLRARGVRLSRDSSDVVEVAQGGSLYIEHVLFPGGAEPAASATVTRTLNVRRGADGGVVRSYRVDGRERDFGAEGRAWLAALLRRSR